MDWSGRHVLITGGLGFIGSTLAHRLVGESARVTLVDAMLPHYGGNLSNIEGIVDSVIVNYADIRDIPAMRQLVAGKEFVFHLASQVSHVDSVKDPFPDIDINVRGTVVVLEALREVEPSARLVYLGTRGQYGRGVRLPVREDAPTHPMGMYAITKLTAEHIVRMYDDVHGIRSVCARLVNTYGPRHQMQHDRYGVLNWFVRKVLDGEPIPIFGDGHILRDYLYVEDATEALLQLADEDAQTWGNLYNIGSGEGISFLELGKAIIAAAGQGEVEFREFTPERLALEPGDYVASIERIREATAWVPRVDLEDGLARTVAFYRRNRAKYW